MKSCSFSRKVDKSDVPYSISSNSDINFCIVTEDIYLFFECDTDCSIAEAHAFIEHFKKIAATGDRDWHLRQVLVYGGSMSLGFHIAGRAQPVVIRLTNIDDSPFFSYTKIIATFTSGVVHYKVDIPEAGTTNVTEQVLVDGEWDTKRKIGIRQEEDGNSFLQITEYED